MSIIQPIAVRTAKSGKFGLYKFIRISIG